MILTKLVKNCSIKYVIGNLDVDIYDLQQNSKKVKLGSLFFCISGTKVDGKQYIFEAVNNGAVAIVLEKNDIDCIHQIAKDIKIITYIFVDDVRKSMAIMSANFYNNPQKKLKMIGITGTNGKTSTSYIIAQMLQNFDKKVGIIGTSGIFINKKKYDATMTTPDSIELFSILAQMVKNKMEYCIMEVSAHAIFFDKVYGIDWQAQVLTNVKIDHLDFFKTTKKYESIKKCFFNNGRNYIVNGDDKIGKIIAKQNLQKTTTFGFRNQNDIKIIHKKMSLFGSKFDIILNQKIYHFDTNLVGKFNLYNFMSAVAVLQKLGILTQNLQKKEQIYDILGRFSTFRYKNNCNIIIDYAHTTDSLKNLLTTLKSVSKNKNIIVFGCPGERESQKRFDMGKIAGKFCETVIVTTDNPASENPRRIAFEIMCGANQTNANSFFVEDRANAIKKAFSLAKSDTNILIVGKGSETYQIIGNKKIPYSDFEEIYKYLR